MKELNHKPEKICVVWHPKLPEAQKEARLVQDALISAGASRVEGLSLFDPVFQNTVSEGGYDVVIAMGGDGTMIRVGKLCATQKIPVMGINMGSLGFLIETPQNKWQEQIIPLLNGEWKIEERMMMHVNLLRKNGEILEWDALNDVVIARGAELHPIKLHVSVSGSYLTTYVADGLIVSSATGSTAYSMAVGGPVLQPEMRNILVIPVAPHLCMDRALILEEGETVEIKLSTGFSAVLSPDGTDTTPVSNSDIITVSSSDKSAQFVRFHDIGFFYQNFIQYMQRNPRSSENGSL